MDIGKILFTLSYVKYIKQFHFNLLVNGKSGTLLVPVDGGGSESRHSAVRVVLTFIAPLSNVATTR